MKRKIILVCMLFLFLTMGIASAQQQYKHCLEGDTVKWSVLCEEIDRGISSTEFVAYGNTLINNLWYKNIYSYDFDYFEVEESNIYWKTYNPEKYYSIWPWSNYFIRESEDASKLYIYDSLKKQEYLISDISLKKGDPFQIIDPYSEDVSIVLVDSIYIKDGLRHVQLNYEPESVFHFENENDRKLTFIEGVGSNAWILYFWPIRADINCFQNQSLFYKSEKADQFFICPCGYQSPPNAIRTISTKNYSLIIKEDNVEINFSIFENRLISIYDISGRLYYHKDFSSEKNVIIPTSSFPKGVYIIKVFNTDNNQINISKIIL